MCDDIENKETLKDLKASDMAESMIKQENSTVAESCANPMPLLVQNQESRILDMIDEEADSQNEESKEPSSKLKSMNVEELAKKLLRGFRKALKQAFDGKYKRLHYHWVDS